MWGEIKMSVYITRINGMALENTEQYRQNMVAGIAHRLGIKEMGIYRYNGEAESAESLNARIDGIIAGVNRGDLVICQFPTGNGLKFEWTLVDHLKAYGGRIAIFLHDLEPLRYEERSSGLWEVVNFYNQAEVMIIPSVAMRQFLLDNHIRRDMKFVIREMWDYTDDSPFSLAPVLKKEIAFIDDGSFEGMQEWRYTLPLNLYGASIAATVGQNVQNRGRMNQREMLNELSKGGFGLVWYKNVHDRQYMEYSISLSLSKFLLAGIPVIVPVGICIQGLIEENGLGLVVQSLDEAVNKMEAMTEAEYQEYIQCIQQFAPALQKGYYTQRCLVEAMQMFYRKDAGRLFVPKKVYKLGQPAFSSTVLKESYGGNLALSWSYKGNTDGFLICDASGKVIFDTNNVHQHYFLIMGHEKDSCFIVKAYVETLKGKLVIAESGLTYLDVEKYEGPKVSLIIPAYNSEDYVARSIDTAMAQSFPDLEIIIVDDGSTDGTLEILEWYAQRYNNVIIIRQENSGPATARNMGIKQANGEYIGFMDSDDMIHPDRIERLYYSAKKNNCDIAITSAYQITNNGYEVWIQYQLEEDVAVSSETFLSNHYIHSCAYGLIVWNKLYRSSFVKRHLFPTFPAEEDVAWTPYILSYANQICYLNDCSYEWDRIIREKTLGIELGQKTKEERFKSYEKMIMFYLRNGNPKRLDLLKKVAITHLSMLKVWYKYPKYEEFSIEIQKIV